MDTAHILFEQLENAGYIKGDSVDLEKVQRATLTEIIELSTESAELTSAEQLIREKNSFAHSASLSLGGGIHPCSNLPCRLRRADELSQFAALYSDKVYIQNFLARWAVSKHAIEDSAALRMHLANSLEVILRLRPLINANRVIPVTTPESSCPHCLLNELDTMENFDPKVKHGLTSAKEYLQRRFLTEAKFTIKMKGGDYIIDVWAPEDLVEHGHYSTTMEEKPEGLQALPEVRQRLMRGQEVKLSQKHVVKLEHHDMEVGTILQNILFEFTVSQSFGTSFLTERPIHIKLLQTLTTSSQQEKRNALIKKHLTTLVPFLDGVDSAELLKLREQEGDSFIVFRQAINSAIDAASDKKGEFTERTAREIYGDLLEPD